MIIKIKSHKSNASFQKVLDYMIHDKDRLYNKQGKSFTITHNLKGDSIKDWVTQYTKNEQGRKNKRKDSVILTHEIISFHTDDAGNISLEKLEDITREYIRRRGKYGLMLAVPHFDKGHYHVHLCVSGVDQTGKGMRLSKVHLQELKKKAQEYQVERYPELNKSLVNYEKKALALSDKQYRLKSRTGRATNKELLSEMIEKCYKTAISKNDFYKKLKECGLQTYIRGGKISGVVFKEKKYRLNRLGFTEERLQKLEKTIQRSKELESNQRKQKGRIINLNR